MWCQGVRRWHWGIGGKCLRLVFAAAESFFDVGAQRQQQPPVIAAISLIRLPTWEAYDGRGNYDNDRV